MNNCMMIGAYDHNIIGIVIQAVHKVVNVMCMD